MKKCCTKECIVSFVAVFALLMGYDFIVHGHLLKGMYEATASLWRTESEMQELGAFCLLYHALLAATLACLYKKVASNTACAVPGEKKPASHMGLCFGLTIGTLMGTLHASGYIWMPIPGTLAVAWFFTGLIQGMLVGLLLSFIYSKMGKPTA